MLRCPPSRITLTAADIDDLEKRLAFRHAVSQVRNCEVKARLSCGPGHDIGVAITAEDENHGQRRAASTSSQATLSSADEVENGEIAIAYCSEAVQQLDGESIHGPIVAHSSPVRHVLDGANDAAALPRSDDVRPVALPLREIRHDAYPIDTRPPRIQQDDLQRRSHRRHARSNEEPIYRETPELQRFVQARHYLAVQEQDRHRNDQRRDVLASADPSPAAALDPAAAVFLPQTRFASAEASFNAGRNRAQELHTPGSYSLRSVPPSALNVSTTVRQPITQAPTSAADSYQRESRRRRASDQTGPHSRPRLNLERYPLLGRSSRSEDHHHASTPGSDDARPSHEGSPPSLSSHPLSAIPSDDGSIRFSTHDFAQLGDIPNDRNQVAAADPPPISDAGDRPQVTVPEVTTSTRTSSLSWKEHADRDVGNGTPKDTTAARGNSATAPLGRQTPIGTLDAATEFLRMRNSPLDDLTERLSRLSASERPRSVGRSWNPSSAERATRRSLLSGDIFQYGDEGLTSPTTTYDQAENSIAKDVHVHTRDRNSREGDITITLDLPTANPILHHADHSGISSPLPGSSPLLGPAAQPSITSHSSPGKAPTHPPPPLTVPIAQLSPLQRRAHASPRAPPPITATPRVRVYNDARSPRTQPQTPADVREPLTTDQRRRMRGRSNATASETARPGEVEVQALRAYTRENGIDSAADGEPAAAVAVQANAVPRLRSSPPRLVSYADDTPMNRASLEQESLPHSTFHTQDITPANIMIEHISQQTTTALAPHLPASTYTPRRKNHDHDVTVEQNHHQRHPAPLQQDSPSTASTTAPMHNTTHSIQTARHSAHTAHPAHSIHTTHARHSTSRSDENDLASQLDGIEHDRRVWLSRRSVVFNGGSDAARSENRGVQSSASAALAETSLRAPLEETPPAEGRWERFLG